MFVSRSGAALLWVTLQGRVYSGRFVSFLSEDGEDQREQLWSLIHEGPMKRKDRTACPGLGTHASGKGLEDTHPSLAEFMTSAEFEGESGRRESPTVTVWCAGGEWKASVKDRAEGLVMWLSAPTWMELWQLVELMCLEAEAPWRHDDQQHPRDGKRVKK